MSGQRDIDKTHLSLDNAEERGFIHRDYIAHCLRWSHVVKHLGKKNLYKKARILDIGCGKEMPLLKTLYTMKMTPKAYMGIDVNRIQPTDMHRKIMDKMGHDHFISRWGTFASQKDIEPQLKGDSLQQAYECLKDYYDSNLLSILFAPLFPKYSRNVIWKLTIS